MRIIVHGIPAPQGSKRHVGNGVMIESSAKVKPWREAVKWAAIEVLRTHEPFHKGSPVLADITYVLPRPKSHYGTGRNAATVKDSAPFWQTSKPDVDKLTRSTFDALTDAGVLADDSQVVVLLTRKRFSNGQPVGAEIYLGHADGVDVEYRPAPQRLTAEDVILGAPEQAETYEIRETT